MSQHIQQHQPHYVHYTPPAHPFTHVAPKDTQRQPQSQPQQQAQQYQPQQQAAQSSGSSAPLVATGDWTKDLVHLAKTAELKCVPLSDSSVTGFSILTDPLMVVPVAITFFNLLLTD